MPLFPPWSTAALTAGRGRIAAIVVLGIFLGLQWGVGAALFARPRLALFDSYERAIPRIRKSAPVLIVAVDEQSLAAYGQWPWPRQRMAELVGRIMAGHPAVLGIDVIWPEPDASSPARWAQQQSGLSPGLLQALRSLPDHDGELARAFSRGPVVVGVAGGRGGKPDHSGTLAPFHLFGGVPAGLPHYDTMLRNIPILDQAAIGHGLLSVDLDPDGMVRRMPLLSEIHGTLAAALSTEMLRVVVHVPWIDAQVQDGAMRALALGPLVVPTQPDGRIWVDLTAHDPTRFVSAADVLSGRLSRDTFDQRLVLIGITGLGLVNHFNTPLGPMPGVEVHAQVMENVFDGRFADRPRWAIWAETGATLVCGLAMVAGLPLLRLRWQAPIVLVLLLMPAGLGLLAWARQRWLLDAATPTLGEMAVFVALLGGSLAEADRHRRRLRAALEQERLAAATIAGELAAAFRIQMGILPKPDGLAVDPRFNLDAQLIPAKHVGGDLYDFFKVDADRLFIAIGDVSGKGVPASLFMAVGKALCKSCALREEVDIGAIIQRANAEISHDNNEMLFITLFAGILDLRTGELSFCNAGHDPPFLVTPGGAPRQVQAIGGPPLCVMDDFPYETETFQLTPREILCLVTDGVTEAMNPVGELMGHDRVVSALGGLTAAADATGLAATLRAAVSAFVAGADPSDDLTLLTVQWTGATGP